MRIIEGMKRISLLAFMALAACTHPEEEYHAAEDSNAAAVVAATSSSVTVESAWARATPPIATLGAVYLTVSNSLPTDDRLLAAHTPVAAKAEIHQTTDVDGVMRMRPVESLIIPAHGSAALQPGGTHLMLIGLSAPLTVGQSFPLTLVFEQSGEITVQVSVSEQAPASEHDPNTHHG